jgi:hypothetical protein
VNVCAAYSLPHINLNRITICGPVSLLWTPANRKQARSTFAASMPAISRFLVRATALSRRAPNGSLHPPPRWSNYLGSGQTLLHQARGGEGTRSLIPRDFPPHGLDRNAKILVFGQVAMGVEFFPSLFLKSGNFKVTEGMSLRVSTPWMHSHSQNTNHVELYSCAQMAAL